MKTINTLSMILGSEWFVFTVGTIVCPNPKTNKI